jgi:DNA-binding NarL/FixJ family response regulator
MADAGVVVNDGRRAEVGRPRRVLLVDDHRTFLELLQYALEGEPDLTCVGVAPDPVAALAMIGSLKPDLVVMDYEFPGAPYDGIQATAMVSVRFPQTRVVLLTGRFNSTLIRLAAEAGARSLLLKDGSLPDLIEALRTTSSSGFLVPPQMLRAVGEGTASSHFSRREVEVVSMLAIGMTSREIADELGITRHTCRGYIKSLLWKLGAHSQLEAVAVARRQGLVA